MVASSSSSTKTPASFADGVNAAMQDLASAMAAPDADLHFGTEMIKVMGTFLQQKHQPANPAGGQAAPPSPPPGSAGGAVGTPGGGGSPAGSIPGGPAGGSPTNPSQPNMAPPSGPSAPGSGPTPGLSPNPDELRRTLQGVAGQ